MNRSFTSHYMWAGFIDTATGAVYALVQPVLTVELRRKDSNPDLGPGLIQDLRRSVTFVNTGGSLLEVALDGDPFCSLGRKQFAESLVDAGEHKLSLRSQPKGEFTEHSVMVSSDRTIVGITPWGFGSKAKILDEPPRGFPKSFREPAGCRSLPDPVEGQF